MLQTVVQDLMNPWMVFIIHIPLVVCSWIGCWIATTRVKRPAEFMRTFGWGIAGGAVGGILNPMLLLMYITGLIMGPNQNRVQGLIALPLLMAEGAVVCLPLAYVIADRKQSEPPVKDDPPA